MSEAKRRRNEKRMQSIRRNSLSLVLSFPFKHPTSTEANLLLLTSPLHRAHCLWTTSGADSAISGTTTLSRSTSMDGGAAATSIMGPRAPPQAEAVPPQKPHMAMVVIRMREKKKEQARERRRERPVSLEFFERTKSEAPFFLLSRPEAPPLQKNKTQKREKKWRPRTAPRPSRRSRGTARPPKRPSRQ